MVMMLMLACTRPPDTDADGFTTDDCGPDDPWTYPGAEEWCDLVDHDCDGEPLPPGVCDKTQWVEALDNVRLTSDAEFLDVVPMDLDADGASELVMQANGLGLIVVPWPGTEDGTLESTIQSQLYFDGGGEINVPLDFDGDGHSDLATASRGSSAWILTGPMDTWPRESTTRAAATLGWESSDFTAGFGGGMAAGNFDDDGLDDLVVTASGSEELPVYLLSGRAGASGVLDLADETASTGAFEGPPIVPGDLDGDGLDDLVVLSNSNEVMVHSGADIDKGSHTNWNDRGHALAPPDDCRGANIDHPVGDWTGDGVADLASSCWDFEYGLHGQLLSGAALVSADLYTDTVVGDWDFASAPWEHTSELRWVESLDADALPDLLVTESDEEWTSYAIRPLLSIDGPPAPGTDPGASGREWALSSEEGVPRAVASDFDGDGHVDLAVWLLALTDERGEPTTFPPGDLFFVPGWGMDWDNLP